MLLPGSLKGSNRAMSGISCPARITCGRRSPPLTGRVEHRPSQTDEQHPHSSPTDSPWPIIGQLLFPCYPLSTEMGRGLILVGMNVASRTKALCLAPPSQGARPKKTASRGVTENAVRPVGSNRKCTPDGGCNRVPLQLAAQGHDLRYLIATGPEATT